jgi:hypothetical protein
MKKQALRVNLFAAVEGSTSKRDLVCEKIALAPFPPANPRGADSRGNKLEIAVDGPWEEGF